ncbi:hypothetical protein F4811DRAFT_504415, partial [Daldinia bambusicola]
MSRHNDREELSKPGRRNRSDARSSVDKLMEEVNAKVGGEPADDAPKEEWDRYLGHYIEELDRKTGSGTWPQLEKAEQFVRRMGQVPLRRVNYSSDEDDLPKASESIAPARQKGHIEGTKTNTNGIEPTDGKARRNKRRGAPGTKKNEVQTASVDKQGEAAAAAAADLESEDAKRSRGGSGGKSSTPNIPPPPPPPSPSAEQSNSQRRKRRRTGLESLESNLGKNWEPHVDERGHRPGREGT